MGHLRPLETEAQDPRHFLLLSGGPYEEKWACLSWCPPGMHSSEGPIVEHPQWRP